MGKTKTRAPEDGKWVEVCRHRDRDGNTYRIREVFVFDRSVTHERIAELEERIDVLTNALRVQAHKVTNDGFFSMQEFSDVLKGKG